MMMLLTALFVLGLQCLRAGAQVTFPQPVANQVISGGVSFLVTCSDSTTAPHFSQMSNFSMLLFAGSYASPKVLYAWDLENTMPSTVQNSIIIPRTIGPSATSAYFLGMSGWLSSNSSVSVTYFSQKFTLQNMTGPSSAIPSSTTSASSPTATTSLGRLILCENSNGDFTIGETGLGAVIDQACDLAALAVINALASATSSKTSTSTVVSVTTSPPVMSDYSTQIPVVPATASSSRSQSTTGATATPVSGSQSQATASSAGSSNDSGTASSRQSAKMVYCLIIAALVLATVVLLFWIWRRYRSVDNCCDHSDCKHSNFRKGCDKVLRRRSGKKVLPVVEDTEKGDGVLVERTVSVDVHVVPVDPRIEERENERMREAESEAAVAAAALASTAAAMRRQRFEEMMGNRASRRASRKTIVAELEGDLGAGADTIPAMPAPWDFEIEERRDTVPDLSSGTGRAKSVVVGQGQQGTIVKGRDAAVIVRVGGGAGSQGHRPGNSRVVEGRDLPPMPMHRTADSDDGEMDDTNYILQILYVKGEHDDDDDSKDIVGRKRKDSGVGVGSRDEEEKTDEALEAEYRKEEKRIRDARKKRLRGKRSQLPVVTARDAEVGAAF